MRTARRQRFEPEIRTVRIVNQLPTGTTFGRTENAEEVFIPAIAAVSTGLRIGDTVQVSVVPNTHDTDVEWFAVHVHTEGAPDEAMWDRVSDEQVVSALQADPLTTAEVAAHLDVPLRVARSRLKSMNRDGTIARSDIWVGVDSAPRETLWGVSVAQFLGDG